MRKLAAASALREQRGMKASRGDTEVFVFLLVPGLSMMSLASAIEPLRAVNSLVHGNAYEWRLTGSERGSVEAANGMRMATMDPEAAIVGADYVFACGGMRIQRSDEGRCLSILRQAARRGARVGALSTGTYMLARAGLIDRIIWYTAPALLGAGRPAVADLGVTSIDAAVRLDLLDVQRVGDDVRIDLRPRRVSDGQ